MTKKQEYEMSRAERFLKDRLKGFIGFEIGELEEVGHE